MASAPRAITSVASALVATSLAACIPDELRYQATDAGTDAGDAAPTLDLDAASGNDGAPQGGVGRAAGRVGQAATFNGQDAYYHVDDNGSLAVGDGLTVAAWINLDAVVGYSQRYLSTFHTWDLKLNGRAPQLTMPTGYALLVEVNLPIGEWHHVAFTYDRATGAVVGYVDGVSGRLDSTVSATPLADPSSGRPRHRRERGAQQLRERRARRDSNLQSRLGSARDRGARRAHPVMHHLHVKSSGMFPLTSPN
jgi:hypothetical protein